MQKIYTAYREADVVCLASPLYFWTISGQLKCVVDRLYAVAECDGDLAHPAKECVLLMAAEGNEYEEAVFWYDNLMKHLNWKGRGSVGKTRTNSEKGYKKPFGLSGRGTAESAGRQRPWGGAKPLPSLSPGRNAPWYFFRGADSPAFSPSQAPRQSRGLA